MNLEDKQDKQDNQPLSEMEIDAEVKSTFKQEYLAHLSGNPSLQYICLECEGFLFFIFLLMNLYFTDVYATAMHKDNQQCTDLIKLTSNSLSVDVVALMLAAVQKDNLEVSINHAIYQ